MLLRFVVVTMDLLRAAPESLGASAATAAGLLWHASRLGARAFAELGTSAPLLRVQFSGMHVALHGLRAGQLWYLGSRCDGG